MAPDTTLENWLRHTIEEPNSDEAYEAAESLHHWLKIGGYQPLLFAQSSLLVRLFERWCTGHLGSRAPSQLISEAAEAIERIPEDELELSGRRPAETSLDFFYRKFNEEVGKAYKKVQEDGSEVDFEQATLYAKLTLAYLTSEDGGWSHGVADSFLQWVKNNLLQFRHQPPMQAGSALLCPNGHVIKRAAEDGYRRWWHVEALYNMELEEGTGSYLQLCDNVEFSDDGDGQILLCCDTCSWEGALPENLEVDWS